MRAVLTVLLVLGLAACSESLTGPRQELALEQQQSETAADSAVVEGVQGGVVVSGVYSAWSSGYTLRAEYRAGSYGRVTVFIIGIPPTGPALAVISGHSYRAEVPLPAGTYAVTVVHDTEGDRGRGPRTVTTERVSVTGP